MSTDLDALPTGFPELTPLGKRIEVLRIERGLSKQFLARHAGTSRQQLWRVMTGKSELTSPLRDRLAEALRVQSGELSPGGAATRTSTRFASGGGGSPAALAMMPAAATVSTISAPVSLADLLASQSRLERLFTLLPAGGDGLRLKRALLDAVEDLAVERGEPLASPFFELRRRVLAGEL